MSVRTMAWAFEQVTGSPMAKLVLVKLADRADEDGECFPSIELIAHETEMAERTVRRHLDALEAAGLISRETRGRGRLYHLNIASTPVRESGNGQSKPVRESTVGGRNTGQRVHCRDATPDSLSKTPVRESGRSLTVKNRKESDSINDAEFDTWWEHVPRKAGKGQARPAYKKARKKTDADTLLAGIQRYAESVKTRDRQYVAHPATWLNGERWLDEPDKPPESKTEWHGIPLCH